MLYKILELVYPAILAGNFPDTIFLDYKLYKQLCIEFNIDDMEHILDLKIVIDKGSFYVK